MLTLLLWSALAQAAFIDSSPPQDILGHWQFDLYDASGAQRGTNTNPFYTAAPMDQVSSSTNITTQDLASASVTQFSGQVSTSGTPTAGSVAWMAIQSAQTVMIVVTGTWTGSLQVEVSSDGGVTFQPRALHVLGSSTFAGVITSNVVGSVNGTAKTHVRMRAISAMTGTAVVKFVSSANLSNVYIGNAIKIVDATATTAAPSLAVKASAAPAGTADTAAVTADRPYKYRYVTGNGTTVVKTGTGVLHLVLMGNGANGGTLTLYDSTTASGTVITALTSGTPSGGLLSGSGNPAGAAFGPIDLEFTTGLTAVTSGATSNAFTLVYY